jgi:hypothetical protein
MRYAGDIALVGLAGAGGAVLVDQLAHSPMDRMAQSTREFNDVLGAAPEQIGQAYSAVFAQGPMSNMDRTIAQGILGGTIEPPLRGATIQADSPAGKKAIELASQIRHEAPVVGNALAAVASKEMELYAKEAENGVSTADVMAAVDQGAGVSQIPAILGGLGLGGGAAALAALARRRGGGSAFQVKQG